MGANTALQELRDDILAACGQSETVIELFSDFFALTNARPSLRQWRELYGVANQTDAQRLGGLFDYFVEAADPERIKNFGKNAAFHIHEDEAVEVPELEHA